MEEGSGLSMPEWGGGVFEPPPSDRCSSDGSGGGCRGGKQTCQSPPGQHASNATEPSVIWGTPVSPRRGRLEGRAGGRGENDPCRAGTRMVNQPPDWFYSLEMMKFHRDGTE